MTDNSTTYMHSAPQQHCVKCGGPVTLRQRVGIGAYKDCRRCGPRWTPPYTPERMALGRGNYADRYWHNEGRPAAHHVLRMGPKLNKPKRAASATAKRDWQAPANADALPL